MLYEESHENLIKQSNYFLFLDKILKNKSITKCQYNMYKKCYSKKEFNYPNSTSNKMISTYFEYVKKDKKMYLYVRLYILFIHFMTSEAALKMIDQIKKDQNQSDRNIMNTILKLNENNKKRNINQEGNKDLCDEKEYLYSLLYNQFLKIINKNNIQKDIKYLDIGCGNGNKTLLISKAFNIPKKNVYGTDVPSWGPYQKKQLEKFEKNHFQYINPENGKLKFKDNTFNFISVILTLHHIPNLSNTLNEIKRILKPNGILMIIEHDALTKYDHLLIEIQHMLYGYIYDKFNPNWKNYIEHRITNRYMNIMEWRYLFEEYKFKYLYGDLIYDDLSHQTGFDNQFYGFWINQK
jgi:ubiquinone/menaquinone biosynthesis C-methylase UbiE